MEQLVDGLGDAQGSDALRARFAALLWDYGRKQKALEIIAGLLRGSN